MGKVVLGGGLSGLSAAYYLSKISPKNVTLLESSDRTGGWIKSTPQVTGAIFEQGPRTIRPRGEAGANTLQLIEELQLEDQIVAIKSNHPAVKNRMIYANNSLHVLPNSLLGLFKKQNPFSKPLIFHLLKDLTAKKKEVKDESIYDFIERRFGDEVADYLISPLICGICAGNAREISVKFLIKNLFEYEQTHGSITNGTVANLLRGKASTKTVQSNLVSKAKTEKWSIYSFKNGCEVLPITLRNYIVNTNTNLKLNTACHEIQIDQNQAILINCEKKLVADCLISAIPSNLLGGLLEKQHPVLAGFLKNLIQNVSVGVVNLQFKKKLLPNPAFGVLVAPKEQLPILGVIFDSCCFPETNSGTVLTVMMGGHWFEHYFGKNPQEKTLLTTALTEVKKFLDITEQPDLHKVSVLRNCIPQYVVGHSENLQNITDYIKQFKLPLKLCGASYHGVSINDVIMSAKKAVTGLS